MKISVEVDDDPRAAYFKQVQYGVYVKEWLLITLLYSVSINNKKEKQGGQILSSQEFGFFLRKNKEDFMLNVGQLNEGFVLDHIEAGKSMMIYNNLGLDKLDCCVAIIKKCTQQQNGQKRHH